MTFERPTRLRSSETTAGHRETHDASGPAKPMGVDTAVLWLVSRGDVVVVRPQGVFDAETIEGLDQVLGDTDEAVVIDLTDCTLGAPETLGGLDPARWQRGGAQTCVVFFRLSARQLLSRAGVTERMALFHRVEDAIQARVLHRDGHGEGWLPR